MIEPKDKPEHATDEDCPAIDGMLRELSHEGDGSDEELVIRIMAQVAEADREIHPKVTVIPMRYVWLAASILIVCCLYLLAALYTPALGHVDGNTLSVMRGKRTKALKTGEKLIHGDVVIGEDGSHVRLKDGSSITLAASSRLTLKTPPKGYRTHLELTHGRLFCRVTKGGGRFLIDAGMPIEVLGTTFGVERTDDYTRTCVYEGRVQVGEGMGTILTRGHIAQTTTDVPSPISVALDANDELAWARPEKTFANEKLRIVTAWISDNSRFKFKISPSLLDTPVTFSFKKGSDLTTTIQAMATSAAFDCEFKDNVCLLTIK